MALSDTTSTTSINCHDDEEDDTPIESNACKDLTKEKTIDLRPVPPFSSGEGLPYAPQGFPNPGDVWGWKVRTRTNKAGYFNDRFLYLPKSLHSSSGRKLRTKLDVERYIKSNFPNMKVQDFFNLFTWQIPSTVETLTKGKSLDIGEDSTEEIGTKRKVKPKIQICSPPTQKSSTKKMKLRQKTTANRKSSRQHHVCPRLAADQDANTVIDLRSTAPDQDANGINELTCSQSEDARNKATENSKGVSESEKETNMQRAGEKYTNETVLENFNDYLDNLEGMLDMPHIETSPNHVPFAAIILDNEMIECCKKKLSSLLAVEEFSSLVSCNNVLEFAALASQIRKDPTLSNDQLTHLKLVEQIPLASVAFLDAMGDIEKAHKFSDDLEVKKQKVLGLKNEYKVQEVQIQEIKDQIRQLESQLKEISSALETMQKTKANVANSIVSLVGEIQVELSEKSQWELKKANSAQRVAEIQEKFSTLKGLTF